MQLLREGALPWEDVLEFLRSLPSDSRICPCQRLPYHPVNARRLSD